ncbi:hypothetical protein EYF80_067520 [Liparis tanakae]|uniref:Secreted protein n=1 Tax=Liparis tanakae TaxID=230148 RepID=A0A4Z2E0M2_9TELE|nr:hypothetical protein EYF80_067520 [Liparis tanakae]
MARCRPPMFSPIQVMRMNLALLLMASPIVMRAKANRRASSEEEEEEEEEESVRAETPFTTPPRATAGDPEATPLSLMVVHCLRNVHRP